MQAHLTVNEAAAIVSVRASCTSEDGVVQENAGLPQIFLDVLFKLDLLAMSTADVWTAIARDASAAAFDQRGRASCAALGGNSLEPVRGAWCSHANRRRVADHGEPMGRRWSTLSVNVASGPPRRQLFVVDLP
jgi:hypothetical protein